MRRRIDLTEPNPSPFMADLAAPITAKSAMNVTKEGAAAPDQSQSSQSCSGPRKVMFGKTRKS